MTLAHQVRYYLFFIIHCPVLPSSRIRSVSSVGDPVCLDVTAIQDFKTNKTDNHTDFIIHFNVNLYHSMGIFIRQHTDVIFARK